MSIFEHVQKCPVCKGEGRYPQTYTIGCGMGTFRMNGHCDHCGGGGWVYRSTGKAVPPSVRNQIEIARKEKQE